MIQTSSEVYFEDGRAIILDKNGNYYLLVKATSIIEHPDGTTMIEDNGGPIVPLHFQSNELVPEEHSGLTNKQMLTILIHRLGIDNLQEPRPEKLTTIRFLKGARTALDNLQG